MTGPRICIRCLITKISVTGWMQKMAYLQGRFDAIPYIDEQTDNFLK